MSRPLITATQMGDTKKVIELLKSGHNVNETDENKMTALHWASEDGDYEIVMALIEWGASPTKKDQNKDTPISLASDPTIRNYLQAAVQMQALRAPKPVLYHPKVVFVQGKKTRTHSRNEYDRKSITVVNDADLHRDYEELTRHKKTSPEVKKLLRASKVAQANQELETMYSKLGLREPYDYEIPSPRSNKSSSKSSSPRSSKSSSKSNNKSEKSSPKSKKGILKQRGPDMPASLRALFF